MPALIYAIRVRQNFSGRCRRKRACNVSTSLARWECDDGDVLTQWALDGNGIILKPLFEVASYIEAGTLGPCHDPPAACVDPACLPVHSSRGQDPKIRLFIDYLAENIARTLAQTKTLV